MRRRRPSRRGASRARGRARSGLWMVPRRAWRGGFLCACRGMSPHRFATFRAERLEARADLRQAARRGGRGPFLTQPQAAQRHPRHSSFASAASAGALRPRPPTRARPRLRPVPGWALFWGQASRPCFSFIQNGPVWADACLHLRHAGSDQFSVCYVPGQAGARAKDKTK